MRVVFAGTPAFALPALQWLIDRGMPPVAVMTQPDRPAGRGRRLTASPVKQLAESSGITVWQPESLKSDAAATQLANWQPDLLVTAAYGLLLPQVVLDAPTVGCWNLHASLLPRWRGASPIQQAILAGDEQTGVSLMRMTAGLDAGPVYHQQAIAINSRETAGQLHDRLARLAADLLDWGLDRLERGCLSEPVAQDPSGVTHAPLIRREDARLDWGKDAMKLDRQVRAFNPWPVAFAEVAGETVRILESLPVELTGPPGERLTVPGRIVIGCGQGALEVLRLQAPGKKPVSARDWLNARFDWR